MLADPGGDAVGGNDTLSGGGGDDVLYGDTGGKPTRIIVHQSDAIFVHTVPEGGLVGAHKKTELGGDQARFIVT